MAGYTRQSSFADGDIIQATDFNDEYNQLVNAFDNTTGHSHDGTSGEGPVIGLIGDPGVAVPINKVVVDDTNNRVGVFIDAAGAGNSVEQLRIQDGAILPVTTNDIDVGSSSLKFKDGYFAGDVVANNIASSSYNSDIIPDTDDAYDLGSTSAEWKDLYLDGTANVDALVIGAATAVTDIDTDLTTVSASDDTLASAKAIKTYVDAQVTAQDLDFAGDSGGAQNVDLDSQSLTFTGGTGIDTTGSAQTITFAIDSTVATLSGSQTLINKVIDAANNTISNINTTHLASGTLDTDLTSVSASDDTLASAKAIKTYVDAQVTAQDLDFQADSGGALSIDLDSETLTFTGGTGIDTSGAGNAVTFAIDSTVATLTGSQALTNKTLTSAVLDGTISGTSIKDEDTMVSDSDTHLATQQSIKAYVDTQVGGVTTPTGNELENVVEDVTPQLGGDLDVNGQSIVSVSAGDIAITPDTTGSVIIDGLSHPQADGTSGQVLTTDGLGQLSFTTPASAGIADVVDDTTPQLGGNLDTNGNDILFADNDKAIFGTGSDLEIYHSGLQSFINDAGTGSLLLQTGGSTKVEVVSGGIIVTGDVQADTATIASLNYPTSDGTNGQVLTTNGSGTLSFQNVTETDPSALAFAIALG
jgi:phosphopantetheinyl transferase (holo-ACP synthase)